MDTLLIAVPTARTDADAPLSAPVDEHFGHCAAYTIVELKDGDVASVRILSNNAGEHCDCTGPVKVLAEQGVRALVAGGMGMRPLMAFDTAGIAVYHKAGAVSIRDAVDAFQQGRLIRFSRDLTCQGGCGDHGHGHGHAL